MNSKITIISAILVLQACLLFADNESSSAPAAIEMSTIAMANLAPVTPDEATFEEMPADEMTSTVDLQPVTPVAADFEDVADVAIDVKALASSAPVVAEFE
jgi:hypothetical protein